MQKPWFLLMLLLAGCAQPRPEPTAARTEADQRLFRISEEYLNGYLAWRPQTGTALGLHQYDGQLTD